MSGDPATDAVGAPRPRIEGPLKVTGKAHYAADVPMPDLAHGWIVTATVPRGRLRAIDTSAALGLPPASMRGPGATPGSFALESAMDEVAERLGLDPLELRLRNEPAAGDFAGYHIAAHADVPDIEADFVAEYEPQDPSGFNGLREIGTAGTAAAIANAVWHATGRRQRSLPIRLDRVLEAVPAQAPAGEGHAA